MSENHNPSDPKSATGGATGAPGRSLAPSGQTPNAAAEHVSASHGVDDHSHPETLADKVCEATGESVANCYQCGKCSGGCPLADEMDYSPNQILRMLQLGLPELEQKAVGSMTIWLCLTCGQCLARCPKEVDLPKIMDYLREEALRRGTVNPNAKDIVSFHKAFMDSVGGAGRVFEMAMITDYKLRSWHFLQDMLVAPKMMARGKLHLLPHMIEGRKAVKRIIKRSKARKEEKE
jgi:heterodisulfide reductase subunit C2